MSNPGNPDLERRVGALEDERGVLATLYRYGEALDYGYEAAWAHCFTEDGRFEVRGRDGKEPLLGVEGRPALLAFAREHTRSPEQWHKHVVVAPTVEVDGDHATARSYLMLLVEIEGVPEVAVFGRYQDRLRRVDAGWAFSERRATIESRNPRTPPIVGGRRRADDSA